MFGPDLVAMRQACSFKDRMQDQVFQFSLPIFKTIACLHLHPVNVHNSHAPSMKHQKQLGESNANKPRRAQAWRRFCWTRSIYRNTRNNGLIQYEKTAGLGAGAAAAGHAVPDAPSDRRLPFAALLRQPPENWHHCGRPPQPPWSVLLR